MKKTILGFFILFFLVVSAFFILKKPVIPPENLHLPKKIANPVIPLDNLYSPQEIAYNDNCSPTLDEKGNYTDCDCLKKQILKLDPKTFIDPFYPDDSENNQKRMQESQCMSTFLFGRIEALESIEDIEYLEKEAKFYTANENPESENYSMKKEFSQDLKKSIQGEDGIDFLTLKVQRPHTLYIFYLIEKTTVSAKVVDYVDSLVVVGVGGQTRVGGIVGFKRIKNGERELIWIESFSNGHDSDMGLHEYTFWKGVTLTLCLLPGKNGEAGGCPLQVPLYSHAKKTKGCYDEDQIMDEKTCMENYLKEERRLRASENCYQVEDYDTCMETNLKKTPIALAGKFKIEKNKDGEVKIVLSDVFYKLRVQISTDGFAKVTLLQGNPDEEAVKLIGKHRIY